MNTPQVARAAVAYLNMLPFFAEDPEVALYESPQSLNRDLAAGRVLAGCSSVIAGLDAGLQALQPLLGVAAEGDVESVYIEPIGLAHDPLVREDWERFLQRNAGGAQRIAWARSGTLDSAADTGSMASSAPLAALGAGVTGGSGNYGHYGNGGVPGPASITILSVGASAQSAWIVETLFRLQGFSATVRIVDQDFERLSVHEIEERVALLGLPAGRQPGQLCCLLMIGDPALERRAASGSLPSGLERLDVAALWQSFSGLPCIFALWFTSASDPEGRTLRESEHLRSKAAWWQGLSSAKRYQLAREFLSGRAQAHLMNSLGEEGIRRYLDHLTFDLAGEPYQQSLALMRKLREEQRVLLTGHHRLWARNGDTHLDEKRV